jgi:hypothetical protein
MFEDLDTLTYFSADSCVSCCFMYRCTYSCTITVFLGDPHSFLAAVPLEIENEFEVVQSGKNEIGTGRIERGYDCLFYNRVRVANQAISLHGRRVL